MVEGGATATATATAETTPAKVTSSFVKVGDRTRFTVELKQGETTIVSWKKLMKDASKIKDDTTQPQPPVNSLPLPNFESRLASGQPIANELNDAPSSNRFSAVIEKIERLYTGKDSSDEEDLGDIPDDDQYDTEDSFIDDAELDEYFEVDKSKTKHDGYFVNRGILEKVEPMESANQQPKKRRRKEVPKAPGDNLDDRSGNKQTKPRKKGTSKNSENKPSLGPPTFLRTSNGDKISSSSENNDKQRVGTVMEKIPSGKVKNSSENGDKSENHKTQSIKQNNHDGSELVAEQKETSGMLEGIDLNLPHNKQAVQSMKKSLLRKKEGPTVKSKVNLLEKSVRELEKMVAESRPPVSDALDGDTSGQCIKRRLPYEIKQKLAKVARLAHAANGRVSNELLNRLIGILGHLIHIRTLKRHLKVMMTTGLTAKQEKDNKFQQAKKEVIEMIKLRIPSLMTKATEVQSNLQESGQSENVVKGHPCMDVTLEDTICNLYDIFVDGLDEDATPQVRKLYAELAELWPKGVMDNHGIKRAICRAKERKRTLKEKNKDRKKVKRKTPPTSNTTEDSTRVDSTLAIQSQSQSQYVDVRVVSDPTLASITKHNRLPTLTTSSPTMEPINTNIQSFVPISSTNVPHYEYLIQEKVEHHQTLIDGVIVGECKEKSKKEGRKFYGGGIFTTPKIVL